MSDETSKVGNEPREGREAVEHVRPYFEAIIAEHGSGHWVDDAWWCAGCDSWWRGTDDCTALNKARAALATYDAQTATITALRAELKEAQEALSRYELCFECGEEANSVSFGCCENDHNIYHLRAARTSQSKEATP